MPKGRKPKTKNGEKTGLGFETTLWAAADKLRNNMDAAECRHVVLRRREAAADRTRACRYGPAKRDHRLDGSRERAGEGKGHGPANAQKARISAGHAGEGDYDRLGSGRVTLRRLGGLGEQRATGRPSTRARCPWATAFASNSPSPRRLDGLEQRPAYRGLRALGCRVDLLPGVKLGGRRLGEML